MERSVFRVTEVARICRVARRTVDKWIDLGLLDFYVLPGTRYRRVNRDVLVRFLEENGMPLRWLEEFEIANSKSSCDQPKTHSEDKTTEISLHSLVLRYREAAKVLGISRSTLEAWTKAGIIPHVRVGLGRRKTILYPLDELKAWLARQSQTQVDGKKSGATATREAGTK